MMRKMMSLRKSIALLALLAVVSIAGSAAAAKQPPASQVNINTASVEQLMEVPGIGQSKAQAIVEYRSGSPFNSTTELSNVKGIGEKLLAKITPYVTTSGSSVKSGTAGKPSK